LGHPEKEVVKTYHQQLSSYLINNNTDTRLVKVIETIPVSIYNLNF
jgi:hypothetical protein